MICWFAGQPTIFMYIHTSTGEKTVYWVVIRQIGGLFNQHNATNSKSFTGQLLYLLDYRAYTWQITAKSRTNVHLADNNNLLFQRSLLWCQFSQWLVLSHHYFGWKYQHRRMATVRMPELWSPRPPNKWLETLLCADRCRSQYYSLSKQEVKS